VTNALKMQQKAATARGFFLDPGCLKTTIFIADNA